MASEKGFQAAIAEAAGLEHASAPGSSFIPSLCFIGARPGYLFGRARHGQGYYLDAVQAAALAEAQAEAEEQPAELQRPLTADELLAQAEEGSNFNETQLLDARGLKRIVTALEKKFKENLELRLKYPDAPAKFLDSEVDLDEQVKSLMQVASAQELYPLLVELNPFPTLMACLTHENADIAADTLELIRELTDGDAVDEYEEEARALVTALLEANALELMVQRITSLDEKVEDEAKAVFNCLAIFENLVEVDLAVAELIVDKTRLLKWLLTRMRVREFDSNKQQASELLAVLTQGSDSNQRKLRETNGIDVLLQCVSVYKNRDPATTDEEEFMQNCFDILCAAMMSPDGKAAFVKAEGVELMWLMLQGKKQSRYGALKLLDFACTRYALPCEKLVDLGGLKHLFGAFMGKAKIKGPRGERDVEVEVEERCVSLIASLFSQLGSRGGRRERVGAKFVEAEYEKTDRLMEMFFRYQEKVGKREVELGEQLDQLAEGEEGPEDEEISMERMDAGLFTLQQAALITGHLWALGDAGLRRRVVAALHLKNQSLAAVREVLLEYLATLGDEGGGAEEGARMRARTREVLVSLGASAEDLQRAGPGGAPPGRTSGGVQRSRAADRMDKLAKPAQTKAVVLADDMDVEMEVEDEEEAPPLPSGPPPSDDHVKAESGQDGPGVRVKQEREKEDTHDRDRERARTDREDRQQEAVRRERKRSRSRSPEPVHERARKEERSDKDRKEERAHGKDKDRKEDRADKERKEDRADKDRADKERADKDRVSADKDRADKDRADKERADKERKEDKKEERAEKAKKEERADKDKKESRDKSSKHKDKDREREHKERKEEGRERDRGDRDRSERDRDSHRRR